MIHHSLLKDIAWYRSDGQEMTEEEWNTGWVRSLAIMFNGKTLSEVNEMGQPVEDDTFLLLLNSSNESVTYTAADAPHARSWETVLDTSNLEEPFKTANVNGSIEVEPRSVIVLRERNE